MYREAGIRSTRSGGKPNALPAREALDGGTAVPGGALSATYACERKAHGGVVWTAKWMVTRSDVLLVRTCQ